MGLTPYSRDPPSPSPSRWAESRDDVGSTMSTSATHVVVAIITSRRSEMSLRLPPPQRIWSTSTVTAMTVCCYSTSRALSTLFGDRGFGAGPRPARRVWWPVSLDSTTTEKEEGGADTLIPTSRRDIPFLHPQQQSQMINPRRSGSNRIMQASRLRCRLLTTRLLSSTVRDAILRRASQKH